MTELRKKVTSGFKWNSFSSIATNALKIIQLLVLARLLVPEDFGLMAMLMVIIGFTQSYADLGISNAIIHFQKITREQLSSLYWLGILVGGIIFIALALTSPLVSFFYNEPQLKNLTIFAAFNFLIIPIGQQFQVLLQKELYFKKLAIIDISSAFLGTLAAIVFAYEDKGVFSLIYGQLVNSTCRSIFLWFMANKNWRPLFHFKRSDLKGFLGFGLYQMGERSINFLGWNLDKMIIGVLLGSHILGLYSMAYQLMVKPFEMFNPIITRITTPLFSKFQMDNDRLRKVFLDMVRIVALVMFPVYFGMIVLADPLFMLMFGKKWLPAVTVFQILAILGFFYSIGNLMGSLIISKGRPDIGFKLNIAGFLLYGGSVWIGAHFGMQEVAWGLVLTTAIILFPLGFWVRLNLIQMKPMEYLVSLFPMLFSGFLMAGVVHLVHSFFNLSESLPHGFFISIFMGITAYSLIIYIWQKDAVFRLWQLQE